MCSCGEEKARARVSHTQQACFFLLKSVFLLLNTKAALVSCAFISCANALPGFLPQLQHLRQRKGKGKLRLQTVLTGPAEGEGTQAGCVEVSPWEPRQCMVLRAGCWPDNSRAGKPGRVQPETHKEALGQALHLRQTLLKLCVVKRIW